jgi:hypothetical protein
MPDMTDPYKQIRDAGTVQSNALRTPNGADPDFGDSAGARVAKR